MHFGSCFDFLIPTSPASVAPVETSEMHTKLMEALVRKKAYFRVKFKQDLTFTRVLLKLGTIRSLMHDIRLIFDERDMDKSGHIDVGEMSAAMKAFKVNLSQDEVKALFKMADFYEDKQLTMKQFIVVLAVGYVLDAIPDLLENANGEETQSTVRTGGRRQSNFNDKERTVRDAMELFTYAYLLFDKDCKGVISRDEVTSVVAENGQQDKESMSILSQERWEEMDWDSNGDICFGEFVYAFTKWVDLETGDEDSLDRGAPKKEAEVDTRQGGQARRRSSVVGFQARKSIKAKISERISSVISGGGGGSPKENETINSRGDSSNTGSSHGSSRPIACEQASDILKVDHDVVGEIADGDVTAQNTPARKTVILVEETPEGPDVLPNSIAPTETNTPE